MIAAAVLVLAGVAVGLAALPASVAAADRVPYAGHHSRATLISERLAVQAGQPFTVALRLDPEDGWHTYWRNPGDSGMATVIDWQLPPGFASGPISWPQPQRFSEGEMAIYGYAGEVLLLSEITPPPTVAAGQPFSITAAAHWLVCREICVPESAELTLTLAASAGPASPDPRWTKAFAQARAALPDTPSWPARYRIEGDRLRLSVDTGEAGKREVSGVWFYPYDGLAISHGAPQQARQEGGVLTIEMASADGGVPPPDPLTGVLAFDAGGRPIEIKASRQP